MTSKDRRSIEKFLNNLSIFIITFKNFTFFFKKNLILEDKVKGVVKMGKIGIVRLRRLLLLRF